MTLDEADPGSGSSLPAFQPASPPLVPTTTLERAPPQDGFLPDRGRLWPTTYDEAVRAIRDQLDHVDRWLREHPQAVPVNAMHRLGHPDALIHDEWWITWFAPNGEREGGVAQNKSRTVLRQENEIQAGALQDSADYTYPDRPGPWVKLSEMARIHRIVYREDPEIVDCNVSRGVCWVGTHRSMHRPYACDRWCMDSANYEPPSEVGFRFAIQEGLIFGEQSYHPDTAPPPAGR